MKIQSFFSRGNRFIAMLLALAMLLACAPQVLILDTAAATTDASDAVDSPISETDSVEAPVLTATTPVVYVNGASGSDSNNGTSAATAYKTLDKAYTYIHTNSSSAGGTIVICGNTSVGEKVNLLEQHNFSGNVLITSNYGGVDYRSSAKLTLGNCVTIGRNITLKDINVAIGRYFFTGVTLTFDTGVSVTATDSTNGITVYTGSYDSNISSDITFNMKSGSVKQILLGGRTTNVGNVTVNISGSAAVTGNVSMGGASADNYSKDVMLQISGSASIKTIYCAPRTGGTVDNVYVRLYGGTVENVNDGTFTGTVNGDVSITYEAGVCNLGCNLTESFYSGTTVKGAKKLTVRGFSGTIWQAAMLDFDTINISEGSAVTYKGEFSGIQTIKVASGCTMQVTAYANASKIPSGTTIQAAIGGTKAWTEGGTVTYGSSTTAKVVYVNGNAASSGTGLTASSPVKSLAAAYELLEASAGGTIVLVGDVKPNHSAENVAMPTSVAGNVTITSKYNGTNYGGRLIFDHDTTVTNESVRLTLGVSTTLENVSLYSTSNGFIFTGPKLTVGEGVTCSGTISLYMGYFKADCKTVNLEMRSGTFKQLLLGGYGADITTVNVTLSGSVKITSNVSLGTGRIVDNLNFTMNGGKVNVIYGTPRNGGTTTKAVLNLNAGGINRMVDYSSIEETSTTTLGSITVNLKSTFGIGTTFGVWNMGGLTVGTRTLNLLGYNGTPVPCLSAYSVVNVFGADSIPSGFTSGYESSSRNLCVHGYSGVLGLDLTVFKKLIVTGSSNVTCAGAVPTNLALYSTSSTLRIRPSQNPGLTKSSFNIKTDNVVVFEDSAYTGGYDVIIQENFDSGSISSGSVTGSPTIGTGVDGNKAVLIKNNFGKTATQYLTFDLSGTGYDITTQDYTVTFWYKTIEGGNKSWNTNALTAGSDVNLNATNAGGLIFSNQDTVLDGSGMSLAQLCFYQYAAAGFTSAEGDHRDADGLWQIQDDEWHHIIVSYDRSGAYCVFVDGNLLASASIADCKNEALGVNKLVFGADALGQYGLGQAYLDNIVVYSGAMDIIDAQAHYYTQSVDALAYEIQCYAEKVGKQYTDVMKAEVLAAAAAAKQSAASCTPADYVTLTGLYNELWADYEVFLSAPEKDALLSTLLISDIHFGATGTDEKMEKILGQIQSQGIDLDAIVSSGDFYDTADAPGFQTAFNTMFSMMKKYGMGDTLFINSLGNHEVSYANADENYQKAVPVYWQNMIDHMDDYIASGVAQVDYVVNYKKTSGEIQSCSYAVTMNDYHFLVLNTDYLKQTGYGKIYDSNGNYTEEGNALDPIRHTLHITDNSFAWMEDVLDDWTAADDKPIFVVSHFLFANTLIGTTPSNIVVADNTVGKRDAELRALFAKYDNLFYS